MQMTLNYCNLKVYSHYQWLCSLKIYPCFTLFNSNHILIAFEEFGFLKFNAKIANKTLKSHTSMQRY